ncbi:MAG TPA: hypothetical protein VEV83_21640 [Parafilimonas sp.]|nr:hypothetical protein [Parafilimonas sp.]
MEKYKKLICPLFFVLICTTSSAQGPFDSSLQQAVSVYNTVAGVNSHLYNGTAYTDYDHRIKGDPFFASTYFADGSIIYDGIFYAHVQMFYDLLHDDVVIKNYNGLPLVLVKDKISSFNFAGARFVRLVADSAEAGSKINGFFQVLFDRDIKLFAKRKKEVIEKINLQFSETYFNQSNAYFILNNGIFYPVSDKRSVLYAMKDKRSQVNKFLHDNKIKFKTNTEADLVRACSYYASLTNSK